MNNRIFDHYREFIPEFNDFLESLKSPAPVHLRVNSIKTTPQKLVDILTEKGIGLEAMGDSKNHLYEAPGLKSPGNLPEYFSGYIHPQAFTSCLASMVLAPEKESLVLDMCSSPGGKTSHLAAIMSNSGVIMANELYASRHIPLGHTLTRLGVINTIMTEYQAQEFPLKQHFDFIMADVPCSGEGRFRWQKGKENDFHLIKSQRRARLLDLQKKIILRGFDLLSDRGIMLYSTCTYNTEENEAVIQHLIENRDAEILPIELNCPFEKGITSWRNVLYDRRIERTARFYPHRTNSVGFFMARIGKGRG
ncbi:hypothetical protein ACFL6W_04630 [Thermodesulfobacteriota bacterium]